MTGMENSREHKLVKETGRVKLVPSHSPSRRIIQLRTTSPQIGQEGRFTVLSYNLLADLYALVSQNVKILEFCVVFSKEISIIPIVLIGRFHGTLDDRI